MDPDTIVGLAVAMGIGLLIGLERERSQTEERTSTAAGLRTFSLTALLGALAALSGSVLVISAFGLVVGAFATVSYRVKAERDPGLTTEMALVVTYLLGVQAINQANLAAALGVVVTVLLLARGWMHEFVRNRLTQAEVRDGVLLAAAALVILPLIPDSTIDPWGALNPRDIWTLAVVFMAINGVGYVALRAFGPSRGLPLAGLVGGFVSSSATHSAMGAIARQHSDLRGAAVAGAALSSVATVIQLALVIAVTYPPLLTRLALPLVFSGIVAVGYGGFFTVRSLRRQTDSEVKAGRAFSPRTALAFAAVMSVVILMSAVLVEWLGSRGALLGAGVAGFADAHAAAASAGALARAGAIGPGDAAAAVLLGFSTNAITKSLLSAWSGGRGFVVRLVPGLVLMVLAAWVGYWVAA